MPSMFDGPEPSEPKKNKAGFTRFAGETIRKDGRVVHFDCDGSVLSDHNDEWEPTTCEYCIAGSISMAHPDADRFLKGL